MIRKEKGVALVTVLGVLALVASWAVVNGREDLVSLKRTENMQASTQAWLIVESAQELARHVLKEDAKQSNIDSLNESWAVNIPPMPIGQGQVVGKIIDASRLLNLNDLVDEKGGITAPEQEKFRVVLINLFEQLQVDMALVDTLGDWMDGDDYPQGIGGAEDSLYWDREYRVKNAPLDRLDELLMIRGFDDDTVHKLRGFVTVRGRGGKTPVNINTAPKEVLQALISDAAPQDIALILERRESEPFESISDLISMPEFSTWSASVDQSRFTVVSDAFIVYTLANYNQVQWNEEMMVARYGEVVKTVYRERAVSWPN